MGIAPDSILGQAVSTVTEKFADLDRMASNYSAQLNDALGQISSVQVAPVTAPTRLVLPDMPVPDPGAGAAPVYTPITLKFPNAPENIDISSLLTGLDIEDFNIPDAPDTPLLNLPDLPGVGDIALPVRPDIDTSLEIPTVPTMSFPEMEALEQISLPAFQFPELPAFDVAPPSASGLTVPEVFINWVEPQYNSELLPVIQGKIQEAMVGSSGLPVQVEQALYARARERDSAETERAVQEAVDTWASRGFSMPPGMLTRQVHAIREQGREKAAELNRDIMVEAAKWEIENMRVMIAQGMALEQLTSGLYENMAKRLFEVARFTAESKINVFNAQIALFNAQNAGFATLSQVFRTKLDAALAKLSAYKTAIDGQVAIGQINQQRVEVFKARLEQVSANVEVYKALMQGASVRSEAIKNQFDAYRADVQAYAEQINAEKSKVDMYDAQVRAEVAKVGMYETQARAYASTIQGLGSKADIHVKGAQIKLEAARTKVTKFLADVDAYKANLQANLNEVQYSTSAFTAQVESWRAQSSYLVANTEMQARYADMATRTNIAFAEVQMSEYTAKSQYAIQQAQIALEAGKAVGMYTAQLAAGAMSAAHVSAGISGNGSASTSESLSKSESTSHNYNY